MVIVIINALSNICEFPSRDDHKSDKTRYQENFWTFTGPEER